MIKHAQEMIIFEDEDLLAVNKPPGWNTHAPSPFAGEGIYDWLRHREPRWASLAIIHRLDKETSGLMVFAKTPRANRSLTEQFTRRQVKKTYVLLTDRPKPHRKLKAVSTLVRSGEKYLSRPLHAGAMVAETRFQLISSREGLSTVEAEPLTGRTHQIRVHAAEHGFPVLGDTLYGGSPAKRLYLHAEELTFEHPSTGAKKTFHAPASFKAMAPDLGQEIREAMIDPQLTNSYRLLHGASDGWPGWYLDRLGDFLLSQSEHVLTPAQKGLLVVMTAPKSSQPPQRASVPEGQPRIAQRFSVGNATQGASSPEGTAESATIDADVSRPFGTSSSHTTPPNAKALGYSHNVPPGPAPPGLSRDIGPETGSVIRDVYHKILQRAPTGVANTSPRHLLGELAPERFLIRENGIQFEVSFGEGYSVGLFLDQRDNRRRLLANHVAADFPLFADSPAGKEVLNTFAYTCAFSVCAAKAGARTTSIDLSRKYLEWGKRNFAANEIEASQHQFLHGDVFDWLRRLAKKQRRFDAILLDPPTFSRSKEHGTFQADKDYGKLVRAALQLLNPGGILFASTNAANWAPEDFLAQISAAVSSLHRRIVQQHYVPQPPDFPITRAEPAYLKAVWMRLQ